MLLLVFVFSTMVGVEAFAEESLLVEVEVEVLDFEDEVLEVEDVEDEVVEAELVDAEAVDSVVADWLAATVS